LSRSLLWKSVLAVVLAAEIVILCLVAVAQKSPSADGLVIRAGDASIKAAQQGAPWGLLVIQRVVTPVPSWVVVQARGTSRKSSSVLGYAEVPAGVSEGITIHLDPSQADINILVVSLLADRGKPGVFEFTPAPAAVAGGGMGGGMGGGGGGQKSPTSADATPSVDKPLLAQGKPVSIVMQETYRSGTPGTVQRSVVP